MRKITLLVAAASLLAAPVSFAQDDEVEPKPWYIGAEYADLSLTFFGPEFVSPDMSFSDNRRKFRPGAGRIVVGRHLNDIVSIDLAYGFGLETGSERNASGVGDASVRVKDFYGLYIRAGKNILGNLRAGAHVGYSGMGIEIDPEVNIAGNEMSENGQGVSFGFAVSYKVANFITLYADWTQMFDDDSLRVQATNFGLRFNFSAASEEEDDDDF